MGSGNQTGVPRLKGKSIQTELFPLSTIFFSFSLKCMHTSRVCVCLCECACVCMCARVCACVHARAYGPVQARACFQSSEDNLEHLVLS